MILDDLNDLSSLASMDLIRYRKVEDQVILYLVGDNEEEEEEVHTGEGEFGDEIVESHHDADDGMNGHLFKLVFHGVSDFLEEGQESDSYHTLAVQTEKGHILLKYDGISFEGENSPLTLQFSYEFYDAFDEGKIEGPDV